MNENERDELAQQFGSFPHNVKSFAELTDAQRREADRMFAGGNGDAWAYLLTNYGTGSILARRKRRVQP